MKVHFVLGPGDGSISVSETSCYRAYACQVLNTVEHIFTDTGNGSKDACNIDIKLDITVVNFVVANYDKVWNICKLSRLIIRMKRLRSG